MYRKALCLLALCNLTVFMGYVCACGFSQVELAARSVLLLRLADIDEKVEEQGIFAISGNVTEGGVGIASVTVSEQRIVNYSVMEQEEYRVLAENELEVLQRIVEAEAGNEDEEGKLLVANVVLNRVDSEYFPETVTEVVFQESKGVAQFSPVASGRYYSVEVSPETVAAVERALAGEDISEGALYFASRRYAGSNKMRWFEEKLTYLFCHGGHEFYK